MADQVPGELADITPGWLAATLRAGGTLPPSGAVTCVAVEQIGTGRGFTGVLARLLPTYQGADGTAPSSLVVKLPTAEQRTPSAYRRAQQGDSAAARRHYQRCAREVAFYCDLAGCGLRAPICHHAVADPGLLRVALLLEDVEGEPGDKLAGCTATQARATLAALAPLHATMWRREGPAWLPPFLTDPEASQQRYADRVDPFLARYGDQLTGPVRDLLHRLRGGYAAVLRELAAAPHTVIHGEPHLDNLMFTGGEAVLLDWQSIRYGPAAFDVAEVVFGSLSPARRRASEDELLAYHAALLAAQGVGDYPVERLRHHCRLALLCHVAGLVGWLAIADPAQASSRERALFSAAFGDGRLVTALQDHGLA